jgi:hypothetical protein
MSMEKNSAPIKGQNSEPTKEPEKIAGNKGPAVAGMTVEEARLAGRLGLTRETLRGWRQRSMSEGEHFGVVGREVVYSVSGVQRLCELAELPVDAFSFVWEAEERPEPVLLVVWRVCTNSRIVLAHREGTKVGEDGEPVELLRIQVRENRNFLKGMRVPAVHESEDVYVLQHACPRWKGRW